MSQRRHWKSTVALTVLLAVLVGGIVAFQRRQFTGHGSVHIFQEKMYLPDSKKLRLATLGFRHLYADLLWLRAIQAFGGRWQTGGGDMGPIFHYFDVVTDLDPQFIEAYKLGNLVIGDEGGDYKRSLDILRKGMWRNPNDWELPYLGIYNAVWQMNDLEQARWFAYMAARKPDRPEYVARMREYIERKTGRYDVAYRMNLQYMLRYLDQGDSLQAKLTSIRFWDILDRWYKSELTEAARRFIALHGRDPETMEELVDSKAWRPVQAPTMESIRDNIEAYRQRRQPLQPNFEAIARNSLVTIQGVPPEPNGYTYYIGHGDTKPATPTLVVSSENAFHLPDSHFSYIINQSIVVDLLTDYTRGMNMKIQEYHRDKGRWPESMEELVEGRFNYKDLLGGEFTYNPDTGEFRCSSLDLGGPRRERIYIE